MVADGRPARTLLVAGTASHVGKSTVAAGLCRLLARRDIDVAPYKAQNMSNNAVAVPRVGELTDGFGEIGVSQYVQARAADVPATTDHNPVLLKPRGDAESQLVLLGEAVGHFGAGDYYDEHWTAARDTAREAHARLAAHHDVIVAEGAGSIAELNLRHRDLANLETARFADADVLLVADVERGGVFASVYGTLELLPDDVRERVVGVVVNKFRGDPSLLKPGLEELTDLTDVPVVGVLPHEDPGLPAEDSVSLPPVGERAVRGGDDGVPNERAVTVVVPRLPRISNFTDFEPLAREPGVRVAYVPPDDPLAGADAVVLPGTKNAVDDLLALREAGFDEALAEFDGPVVGLCGGYQVLGERLLNASVEGTGERDELAGFGLLPVETTFSPTKRVTRTVEEVDGVGPLAGAAGTATGYEIHAGETRPTGPVETPLGEDSAAVGNVLGTYLHGLFENEAPRRAFVEQVFAHAGRRPPARADDADRRDPYEHAADLVAEHVDLAMLGFGE